MASENDKIEVQQSNSTEKEETKMNEKKEEQMNNKENNKELGPRPTDKEKQAHSNQGNEKISTTNEKNQLETQQPRELSSKETFQQAGKGKELSASQNFIGSDEKVNPQQKEI